MKRIKLSLLTLTFIALTFSGWGFRTGVDAIPDWCKVIFHANVTEAMNHPLISEFLNQDRDFSEMKNELANLGIDINKDNVQLTFGSTEIKDNNEPDYVALIDIDHDENKLIPYIKNKAKEDGEGDLNQETIKGYTVLSSKKSGDFPKIAFLKGKHILLATPSRLNGAIDSVEGQGNNVLSNRKLNPIINSIKGNNLFWGVMEASDFIKNEIRNSAKAEQGEQADPTMQKLAQVSEGWDALQLFSSAGSTNSLIFGSVSNNSSNAAESTKALGDLLDQTKMMMALFLPPEMNAIISGNLEVVQTGNAANITLDLTNDEIREIKRIIEEMEKETAAVEAHPPSEDR